MEEAGMEGQCIDTDDVQENESRIVFRNKNYSLKR